MLTDALKSLVVGALVIAFLFGFSAICVAYPKVFWAVFIVVFCWVIGGLLRQTWRDRR